MIKYDPNGGGIVVVESRRLPDIPYGRVFILKRKISIVFESENATRILISAEVNMLPHKSWPEGIEPAIDSEIMSMVCVDTLLCGSSFAFVILILLFSFFFRQLFFNSLIFVFLGDDR